MFTRKYLSIQLISLGIVATGLLICGLIHYFSSEISNAYSTKLPYISLGDNIKNKTTKGHLWFEELMSGDEGLNFEQDILALFTNSSIILEKAKDGGETELGAFGKTDNVDIKQSLTVALKDLDALIVLTKKRYELKQSRAKEEEEAHLLAQKMALTQVMASAMPTLAALSGGIAQTNSLSAVQSQPLLADKSDAEADKIESAGGLLDQQFDEAYEKVQTDMDKIIEITNADIEKEHSRINKSIWLLFVIVFVIFGVMSLLNYKYQKRNQDFMESNKERLEHETDRLTKMKQFVNDISGGNFDATLDLDITNDELGSTLNNMRSKLKSNYEDDQRRNWMNIGLAKMSEILRTNDLTNTDKFYNDIISFIVKYLDANQGGLFILNNDHDYEEPYLELVSCYAYGKRKYLTKQIASGEGLVGQCYLEKETILMTEVPDKYTEITSGLGSKTPDFLLLVPLKVNDEINGVMEIASFKKMAAFELDFIHKISESISASIAGFKVSVKTSRLLAQTQQQSAEMKAQEEELRQNLEELQATQEEFERKEREYIREIETLNAKLNNV